MLNVNSGEWDVIYIGFTDKFCQSFRINYRCIYQGSSLSHVAVEAVGIVVGIIVVAWILVQNQMLTNKGTILTGSLAAANQEAQQWKNKSQELLMGLGAAIDDQFGFWKLTKAEREVGLLLLKGLSLKEISEARGTAERTTRQQAHEICRKSGISGRAEFSDFFLEDLLLPIQQVEK